MTKSLYEAPREDYDLPAEKDGVKHFTARITPDVMFSMSEKQSDTLYGTVPNIPWWRLQTMTDEEIRIYNRKFLEIF